MTQNINALMDELYDTPEYQEWDAERDAELIAHMEEDFAEDNEDEEEFDYIEYCDYMSELIAMATARDCDEGMF